MGDYQCKYMTVEQQAAIDKLFADGHAELLKAFGWECVNAWKEGSKKGFTAAAMAGAAIGLVLSITTSVGRVALQKWKEKKLEKETEPEVNEE